MCIRDSYTRRSHFGVNSLRVPKVSSS